MRMSMGKPVVLRILKKGKRNKKKRKRRLVRGWGIWGRVRREEGLMGVGVGG